MARTHLIFAIEFLTGLTLLLLAGAGCQDNPVDVSAAAAQRQDLSEGGDEQDVKGAVLPFADAEVFFEFNTTDNDLGLQVFLDAEGWSKVDVSDPDNHKIVQIHTQGPLSDLGITELRFESEEPSPAQVLALFPPGEYDFRGKTVEGDRLQSTAELSHEFVAPFTFSPSGGAVVDPGNTTIMWEALGAELVEIIIENEENDNLFDVTVEGEAGSLDVPPQFLEAGIEYKIELLAYHESGNRTIVESTFITQ